MKKSFIYCLVLAASLAACTDDYKDWAMPQSNAQEAVTAFGDGSVATVASINFANIPEGTAMVKVCDITAPTSSDSEYKPTYTITLGNNEYSLNENGEMQYADLKDYVEATFGKRPVERTVEATINSWTANGMTAIRLASSKIQIKAIPIAPVIESRYYVTGNCNGWDNSNLTYAVVNGGGDVYDDAIFKVMIPASSFSGDLEFKLTPESGIGGDWSKCVCAGESDGKIVYDNAGGNIKIPASDGAKYYSITFDMLGMTWSYKTLSFGDYFYEIGNESGWSASHPLYGPENNGIYQGFYWLDGEFKFKPNEDNWDGDYEYDGEGKIADNGGSNCPAPATGFYRIDVNLGQGTYTLTPITVMSLIGSAVNNDSSWGTDYDLTYNVAAGAWEGTFDMTDGEYKIRADHDWTYSWGGSLGAMTSSNGSNLSITAGRYKFSFKPDCNGKGTLTVTAQ